MAALATTPPHERLSVVEPRPVAEATQPELERKTVANSAARVMLYLPPKAKRKVREIAFYENRKEHDIYVEALREYLERHGHGGLL